MKQRVTLRDIAKKTGYHYSTVSLALRGELRLPSATRETVCRAAQEMGYQPDPMLTALALYKHAIKPSTYHATLAWLVNDSQPSFGRDHNFKGYLKGAREYAEALGYKIEEFLLGAAGMTPRRMSHLLQSRGISGILVSPQRDRRIRMRIAMDWSPFAAVSFGYTLAAPQFHRVTNHHFRAAKCVIRKLKSRGYRRIGLCIHRVWNGRVDGGWLGGYLSETWRARDAFRIHPLEVEDWDGPLIAGWIKDNRLDAVIVDESRFIDLIRDSLSIPVPSTLGAACLALPDEDLFHSGIYQNDELIGRTAVDLLVGLLHANWRGIPPIQHNLLIEGTWKEGRTLRRAGARVESMSSQQVD